MINKLLKQKITGSSDTIKQIAKVIGVSRQQLYNYMDENQIPNVAIANSLSRYFNMSTEELFPYHNKSKDERYGG